MNFFAAVVFFCLNEQCVFWKADENFYEYDKCEAKLMEVMKEVEDNGGIAKGVCLPMKPNQA